MSRLTMCSPCRNPARSAGATAQNISRDLGLGFLWDEAAAARTGHPAVGDHGTESASVGDHGIVSDFVVAGGRELPNPASVQTREDLARQLTLLRLSTPGPRPGRTLTMRELSDRSKHSGCEVAHSTIGNAESGRILPSGEVVYGIAKACGLPDIEIRLWLDARERVWLQQHRPTLPTTMSSPTVTANQATGQALLAMHPARALRTLVEMGTEQAADMLVTMSQDAQLHFVTRLKPPFAAATISEMLPQLAGSLLDQMPPEQALTLLRILELDRMASLVVQMETAGVCLVLDAMDPTMAVRLLAAIDPAKAGRLLAWMNSRLEQRAEHGYSTRGLADPGALLAALDQAAAVRLLATLEDTAAAGRLLATLNEQSAGELLAALDQDAAGRLLLALDEKSAGRLLAAMNVALLLERKTAVRLVREPTPSQRFFTPLLT